MRICFRLILCVGLSAVVVYAADSSAQPGRIVTVVRPDPRSGKLVRKVLVSPKGFGERGGAATARMPRTASSASAPDVPTGIDEAVRVIASQHSLSPELLHSVIKVESNYNPMAVSSKGALGLMQLIPSTARRFGVTNVFNPVENIEGGARYLRYLLNLYNGNPRLALAAYNAGERAVAKYGGVPPFPETQNYVIQVGKQLAADRRAGEGKSAEPEEKTNPAPAGPAHIVEIHEPDGSVRYVSR
jgi:soluble lytic murein transglycosylase-like protein